MSLAREVYLLSFLLAMPATHALLSELVNVPLGIVEWVSRASRERGLNYSESHVDATSARTAVREGPYDFVVVGAGAAGSVLANRLTEGPKKWRVLLLEAGGDENALTDIPVLSAVWQSTPLNWGYKTEPQDNACLSLKGRQCRWPRGKVLGGSTVINYMIHTRGHPFDYDSWAAAGNDGWSWEDVLPYFKRLERTLVQPFEDSDARGHDGPVNVESVPYVSPLAKAFIDVGDEMGLPKVDYNADGPAGLNLIQANLRNGSRCSANKAYLRPIGGGHRRRRNLTVVKYARVTKVIIDPDSRRATGVEFRSGFSTYEVNATKEVLVSAGTLLSPQILMLSGVGPREHLEQFNISVVVDLPVGYGLQEHPTMMGPTFIVNDSVSLKENRVLMNPLNIPDYIFRGKGPLTSLGGAEGVGYIRTKLQPVDDPRPDVELLFVGASVTSDNGMFVPWSLGLRRDVYNAYWRPLQHRDAFMFWPIALRARSRGRVLLRSADPADAPIFQANIFRDTVDVQTLVEAAKAGVRMIEESEAFRRYNATLYKKPVPGCQKLPFASDEYWECAARHMTCLFHHQVGTCRMGPAGDETSVVDPQLRVHGISGLRVVDASVMPDIPSGHTAAPTYMIGEKAADMIKETWESD